MSGLRGGWGGALGFPGVVGWCVPPALCAPHPGVSSPASLWAWAPGRASPPLAFSVRLHPPAASVPPGRACCAPTAAGDPGALRHGSHGRDASALPGQGAVTVLAALGPPPPGPAEVGAPAVAPMPPGHSCAPVTAGGGWRRPEQSLGGCGFSLPGSQKRWPQTPWEPGMTPQTDLILTLLETAGFSLTFAAIQLHQWCPRPGWPAHCCTSTELPGGREVFLGDWRGHS